MPSPRKMPPGKTQFGIIVPNEVHSRAKQLSGIDNCRISEVYAKGVNELWDEYHAKKRRGLTQREKDEKDVFDDMPDEYIPYLKAVASYLRTLETGTYKDESNIKMMGIMFNKYLPATKTKQ